MRTTRGGIVFGSNASRLKRRGDVPGLLRLADNPSNEKDWVTACEALEEMGETARPALTQALEDGPPLGFPAATALGELAADGNTAARTTLVQHLVSAKDDETILVAVLQATCRLGGADIVDAVVALLSGPKSRLALPRDPADLLATVDVPADPYATIGPKSTARPAAMFAGPVFDQRYRQLQPCLALLAKEALPSAAPVLRQALSWVDPTLAALSKRTSDEGMFWPALNSVARCDNEIRALAAQGLGRIRDAEAVSALQSLLHPDVDDNVAKAAAAALGEIGDPASIPLLADLLLRPPHRVIDESDVDFDDPEDVEFARELWEMEDEVPVAAARALAAIGTPDARRALEEAAAGELQSAARAARAALAARP